MAVTNNRILLLKLKTGALNVLDVAQVVQIICILLNNKGTQTQVYATNLVTRIDQGYNESINVSDTISTHQLQRLQSLLYSRNIFALLTFQNAITTNFPDDDHYEDPFI